ncbi:MAG TPA: AAA family ATPase [Polyangiales bacterium]|nr:AAA family ATPase [Polyangiales bacterium]
MGQRRFDGAVLVADIAGYSALSEGLGDSGPDGIERLGKLLGATLSALFALVERHGGRIGATAGDAIIAYWPFEASAPRAVITEVNACVRELLSTPLGPQKLSIHAGLSAGPIWSADCEGWQTQSLFGGAAVREAFQLAKTARTGQLLTSESFERWSARPTPDPAEAPAVRPSRIMSAATRAVAQNDPWSAELCNVAALFMRFAEFDETRPGEWQRHGRALLLIRELAGSSRAGGRLVIDERGLVCVSVFGEPTGASAEAPNVMTERARELTSALQSAGFPVAAGLAFGPAFCGRIGIAAHARTTLVTVGPVMNLAARLMERAGNELLVAEPTAALFRSDWPDAPVESLSLRGLKREVRARRPPLLQKSQRAPLFGRDEERARLRQLLTALGAGSGGICLVRADAGMGKSRLLHAVEDMAGEFGARAVVGQAREAERTATLFPWRAIVRGLFPWAREQDADIRAPLSVELTQLGQDVALAPLLNGVLHASMPETERSEALVGRNRAEATLELLLALIRNAAQRPIVIGIDDIHVADSASLELAARVGGRLPGVLLIATARPSPQTSELIYQLAGPRYHQLDLHALARADVAAIIVERLGHGEVEPALIDAVQHASEGNPLFAQEYLALLIERGRVDQSNGRTALLASESRSSMPPPPTVVAAVSSRIHALPAQEQLLLKIASVIGETFSTDTLEQIVHLTPFEGELDAVLRNLEQSGLLTRRSMQAQTFSFSHAVVREAAYETMLLEQRSQLHAAFSRILERRYERERDALLPVLVRHAVAAGDERRTLLFADTAALAALRQGSLREAAEFLRLCLAAEARTPDPVAGLESRVRWNRQLSEAMGALGDLSGRRSHALAAIRSAGVRVHRSSLAARVHTAFTLLWRAFAATPGRRPPKRLRANAVIERELAHAFHQLMVSNYFASDRVWFPHYALRALEQAGRLGRSPELVRSLAATGACLGYLGLERTGRRYLAAATTFGEALGDQPALAFAHMVSALYHVHRGGWVDASRRVRRCQASAKAIGDNQVWGEAQTISIWIDIYRGEISAAERSAQELRVAAERSGNEQHLCWAHRFSGLCHLRRGELPQAVADLETAQSSLVSHVDLNEVALADGVLAGALARAGRLDEAKALAIPLLERIDRERRPTSHSLIEGCSGIAEVVLQALETSDASSAKEWLHRAELVNRSLARLARPFSVGWPRYHYFQGRLLAHQGKLRAAHKAWRRGRQQALRLSMKHDLEQLDAVLASAK